MKAVVYEGARKVEVQDVEKPTILESNDAILKVTSAAICGSDLHMYDGRTSVEKGKILGHEIMGVIAEVGPSVRQLKVGDRVVLPFNIACGTCYNCTRGFTNACLTMNPEGAGAAYGYAAMGPYSGGQAEFVRVPFADFNALKLPGTPGDEFEDDFLMLADIFPTGYHATELAKVGLGMSVAIYGAGPVGLLSALSCKLKGATEVYVVDAIPSRLMKAQQLGAIPIDFSDGDPVEQIKERRHANKMRVQTCRPGEEKLLDGVNCGIDAVGYQAHDEKNPSKEKPTQVIDDLVRLVNPTGHIGIIGVFMPQDPNAPGFDLHAKKGEYVLPFGELWHKGISVGTGQCPVKRYNELLRDLIIDGQARPGVIISHHMEIGDAATGYEVFDKREEGYTKIVLKPALGR